ncbi:MAG: hypothetical protein AABY22_05370 [Nanoarchaeota archaeon]
MPKKKKAKSAKTEKVEVAKSEAKVETAEKPTKTSSAIRLR